MKVKTLMGYDPQADKNLMGYDPQESDLKNVSYGL